MKKFFRTSILAVAAMLGCVTAANAQLAMTRSIFAGAYSPIATGTGATLTSIAGDDGTQTLIPIGFTFNYLGTNYTTVDACSNGWISFNAGGANAWTNANLFTTTTPNLTLAPWWDDLNVGTGSVLYQLQGTPGSQTFTVQWTDVLTYNGSATGRTINFQVILYEGTNVIEFRYSQVALAGTLNTNESASIGIEGATGGPGNFLDAVSGSAFINQSYMTTHKWPTMFYRFTPGAPTVLPGGMYTVGLSGTYTNLTEAFADINHRGISGPVTLTLLDAVYDTTAAGGRNIFPLMLGPVAGNSSVNTITVQPASGTATLTYRGTFSGAGGIQSNSTAFGTGNEPILAIVGTDYVTVRSLNLQGTGSNTLVDRGILVSNATGTDGSQNGLYENISVTLSRTNTSSIGIQQATQTSATSAAGANSGNIFRNLTISNTYSGIYLIGTAAFPDLGCVIGNSVPTAFNAIGSATANDIGNGGNLTYGIRCGNQSGVSVFNNEVRNVTVTGAVACDGILMELTQGTSSVQNNIVHDIRCSGTSSTSGINGIRANVATTGTHELRVYNNFVYGITSAYTGAGTATRVIRGIYVQSAGGGATTQTINVDNNSVLIDGSASANLSNTCFEIGTSSGPVMNVRNNIFSNPTAVQTAPAAHYAWVSTSATLTGNTGSVSDRNDLHILNTTQGFVGLGNATQYATLANWQAGVIQDAGSVSVDPGFVSVTNLHASAPQLDAVAFSFGWIVNDIDNQLRSGTPDIGADEFTVSTLDAGVSLLVTPVAASCYTSTQQLTVRLRNFAASALDLSANNVTIVANVTGAVTQSFTVTLTNNLLNAGNPIPAGSTIDVPMGIFNMSVAGTYTFNSSSTLVGDVNAVNDGMTPVNISFQAGTITVTPSGVCAGSSTTLALSGNTSTTIQWEESTDGGVTWTPIVGATTSTYVHIPSDTTWYHAVVCGVIVSTQDTVLYYPTSAPVTVGDTVCGLDTALLTATGSGTLYWFTSPSGGSAINTGTTYAPLVSATTTYYVESSSGSGIQSVGLTTNAGGGGQQTSTAYNIFDVTTACTIAGAYVYPGAAGNIVCDLRDNTGALIATRTVAVTAADINQRTYVALNIPLTVGTGFRLAQGAGSVSMFRNSAGVTYPYTLPGTLSITGSSAGGSFYYFFYDWQILTGCSSVRTPVTAEVVPTAPVTVAATPTTLCAGDSASLVASSVNLGYSYSWTPSATLSAATGATVMAGPASATSYIVTADSAGCIARDTISIAVNLLPGGAVSAMDTLICIGQTDSLIGVYPMGGAITNATVVNVPDANPAGITSTITVPFSTIIGPGSNMTVTFNMAHTWDADMSFTLISPLGTTLDLCSGNGGSADNFIGTTFNMSAATNITAGTAPFTGVYIPEGVGGFNVFNGESTSGTWTLFMVDGAGGDLGVLSDWSIGFADNNTISWTSNPIGFTSTNDTVVVSPTVTTDYIFTVTDTTTGCSSIITQTVVVNPSITIAVSNDSMICAGDSIVMSVTAAGGDGNYSYSWSNGTITALDSVSPSANTVYTVTVSDGCTTPVALDSVSITIAAPVSIVSISNDTTVCSSSPLVLAVTSAGGNGNPSYTWNNGPITALDSITSGSAGSSTVYVVTVTEACGTTAVDSVTVTSISAPVAMVMTADTTVCSGDTVVAMGMATSGDGNYSYSWNNGPVTALDSITALSSATYVFTVTDGCGNAAIDSVTINTFGMPAVSASNDTAVCFPNYAYLSTTATGGDGNYSYMWTSGTTTSTDSVALFGTMMQYITLTDGCGNTSMDSVLVTVNMMPTAAFTESSAGAVVTFTDGSVNATSWSWNFGDSQTSTQQSPVHTYSTNGTFTVTLIVTNSCGSDTITSVVLIDVGINDPAVFGAITVYPNPASDLINVNFGMETGGRVSLQLFDAAGKLVYVQDLENVTAGSLITLDVTNFETGIYMLRIVGDNAAVTHKLNVQH